MTSPPCYMIKCNTNGAAKGVPRSSTCGGLFKDCSTTSLMCFVMPLGIDNALFEKE